MTNYLIELPTHLVAHLQNPSSQRESQVLQKSHQANAPRQTRNDNEQTRQKEGRSANSGFAKKRVQWLIEHPTSHQLLWYVDNFVLRNPLLRKAANRQAVKKVVF